MDETSKRAVTRQLQVFSRDFHKPAAVLTSFRRLAHVPGEQERLRINRGRNQKLIMALRLLGLGYVPVRGGGQEETVPGDRASVVAVEEESFIVVPMGGKDEEGLDEKEYNDRFEQKIRTLLLGDANPKTGDDGTWGGQWAGIIKRTDRPQPFMIEDPSQNYAVRTPLGTARKGYSGDFYTKMTKGPQGVRKPTPDDFGDTLDIPGQRDVGTERDRRSLVFPPADRF